MRWPFLISILFLFLSFAETPNPVLAIKAKKVGDDVHLSWRVDEKAKPHDFIIQRSLDNHEFDAISIVTGDGSRVSALTFGYVDENVIAHDTEVLFYRVVAINSSGDNLPSTVASVSQKESKGLIIDYFILPEEPQKLFVAYRANGEGDLFLQVFAPSGTSLFYKKIPKGPGFQVVEVPVAPNADGTFKIQLFDDLYAVEKDAVL